MKPAYLLLALLASACAPAPDAVPVQGGDEPVPDRFVSNGNRPDLALLEYVLDNHFAAEPGRPVTTCAMGGNGPRPMALSDADELAMMKRFPGLAPHQRCTWKDGRYVDSETGIDAMVFDVHGIECGVPTRCTAFAGWTAANLGAEYQQYDMTFTDGNWAFERGNISIMS